MHVEWGGEPQGLGVRGACLLAQLIESGLPDLVYPQCSPTRHKPKLIHAREERVFHRLKVYDGVFVDTGFLESAPAVVGQCQAEEVGGAP